MTWTSLWWRVCLLVRLHGRRVRVRWLLWRRSRRTLRPVVLSVASNQFIDYCATSMPGDITYLRGTMIPDEPDYRAEVGNVEPYLLPEPAGRYVIWHDANGGLHRDRSA